MICPFRSSQFCVHKRHNSRINPYPICDSTGFVKKVAKHTYLFNRNYLFNKADSTPKDCEFSPLDKLELPKKPKHLNTTYSTK